MSPQKETVVEWNEEWDGEIPTVPIRQYVPEPTNPPPLLFLPADTAEEPRAIECELAEIYDHKFQLLTQLAQIQQRVAELLIKVGDT